MEVKQIHDILKNWYVMMPRLTGVTISDEPKGSSAPSTVRERKLDIKIAIEMAVESLGTPDGVVLTKQQQDALEAELERKLPIKKIVMGATACNLLGRSVNETRYERKEVQREQEALMVLLGIARLHQRSVEAVMRQSARVGAPVTDSNVWHYLQWELGLPTDADAEKVYFDALYRMSLNLRKIEESRVSTPEGFLTVGKLVESLRKTGDPALDVSPRTVANYVQRGILLRRKIDNAGANGGPSVWVYDVAETTKRLKLVHDLRQNKVDLDTIEKIVNGLKPTMVN